MFHGFFLGILGGLVAAKIGSRLHRGGCGGGACADGGGCGRGFNRGFGRRFSYGYGPRAFGRFGFFRLVRELDLTEEQWQKGHDILHTLRNTLHEGRQELHSSFEPLLSILSTPEWNAGSAEEVAQKHDAAFGRLRKDALAALEELHRLLTPQQREKLARFLERQRNQN